MLNFLPLHGSCIFHVSDPLEKQWALFIFCISLTKLGSQVGGAQIRRALIRYSVVFLVHFRGKKKSYWRNVPSCCVEVSPALESVTNTVTQPT